MALHELYRLLAPVRPLPLAGFLGLAGLLAAATYGDQFQMVLALTGAVLLTGADGDHAAAAAARHAGGRGDAVRGLLDRPGPRARRRCCSRLDHGDSAAVRRAARHLHRRHGAYFGGRLWGTTQLAPRISPAKTVEGLIAGFISGTMAFWFAGLYQDWLSGIDALIIGACVAAAAPLGDLFESMVKRDLAVKDSGRFFGEHGGVLDRLDAAIFTVIVGYYVANALLCEPLR